MDENRNLINSLLQCGVVKFGNFKLKSGAFSPIYIDLRQIINYPSVVKELAIAVYKTQKKLNIEATKVCGVPYTALPIASVYSVLHNVPMVMKRKEMKDHGTKRLIEGSWNPGDTCLIIEDIVSSGTSIIETTEALRPEGLVVKDCIVIINRKQGGVENAKKIDVNIHPLIDIDHIISVYTSTNQVEPHLLEKIQKYFEENRSLSVLKPQVGSKLSYLERAKSSRHILAKKLFELMEDKKTNLCVAIDTTSSKHLIQRAEELGPHICILKTHIDMLQDFSVEVIEQLQKIASLHKFLIMEDRKFADIGNTVKTQYTAGIFKIYEWADIVTVHAIPGDGIIKALKSINTDASRGCVLVAEMSSNGNLTDDSYKEKVFKMADQHADFVIGYVSQHRNSSDSMIHMCPGVNLESTGDSLGQQYRTIEDAISSGADVIIVGRGIDKASNVVNAAVEYKTRGFNAYLKSIN